MSSTAAEPNPPAPAAVRTGPADAAEAVLERAGYKPELRRSLRFFSMFAIDRGGPLWRLKKGTAGVRPVEDLVQRPPDAA